MVFQLALMPTRPVALQLGTLSIYWYGVLYVVAFVVALYLLPRLQRYRRLTLSSDAWLTVLIATMLGVLVGGRLGYVFLYAPGYFLAHPQEIVALWHGGMAAHGGIVGVGIALWLAARYLKQPFWSLLDVCLVPIALGLALGRFGNYINQELYGTLTQLPWGITIPGVDGVRHPVQLYGVLKNCILALLVYLALRYRPRWPSGVISGLFLLLYGVGRFGLEYVRHQEYALVALGPWLLTRGQLLCVPVIGVALIVLYGRIYRLR